MKIILIGAVAGALGGAVFGVVMERVVPISAEERIAEFYATENAVHVSPHGLRKHLGEDQNIVLVDLRSREEYETAHITTAINIPAYASPDKSDYGAIDRIVGAFASIPEDKEIIIYCYSTPCMTGRKIGLMLAEHGIYVKHLGIGWNEWRYGWDMWNHDGEVPVDADAYITSGPDPGMIQSIGNLGDGCTIEGEFGC